MIQPLQDLVYENGHHRSNFIERAADLSATAADNLRILSAAYSKRNCSAWQLGVDTTATVGLSH
jgi:hypothetical protein